MGEIKRQGTWNSIITYLGVAIGFISLIFVQPNLLSPSELGLTRVMISFASFLATIFPLGVSNVNVRYFPFFKDEAKRHHGYFGLMLLFPFIGSLIGAGLILWTKQEVILVYEKESDLFTDYFGYVLPLAIIIAFLVALNSYLWALFRTVFPSFLSDILNRILFILIIILYFFKLISLDEFIKLFVAIYAFQLILLLVYIWVVDRPGLLIDFDFLKSIDLKMLVRYGLLLMLTSFSSVSLKYLDSMMIAKYLPLAFVGIYSIGAFVATIIETPLYSMERIATAKIAQAWSVNNIEEIRKIYYMSSRYMSLIGGLLLVGVTLNISDLLLLLPEEYHSGATITYIMSISAFINMATGVNYSILFNSSKYIYGVTFIALLLVMTVIGNIVLIPKYGIEGAALGTAIAGIIYNALKYLYIWKVFKMQPFDSAFLKILTIILIAFIGGLLIPSLDHAVLTIVFRSSVITVIYLVLTYWLNIVSEFHHYLPWIKKIGGK